MMALVEGLEAQQVRGRAQGSGGPFLLPATSGDIISECADGAFSAVVVLYEHVEMRDLAGQFQVGVGDSSV